MIKAYRIFISRRSVLALFLLSGFFTHAAEPFTVATFNIQHGMPMNKGPINLENVADAILKLDADIVCLQEVDVKSRRAHGLDQAAELARRTGMHHVFVASMPYDGGEYGNAILCKTPILSAIPHALPRQGKVEPRSVLEVTFRPQVASPIVRVFATHLDHLSKEGRTMQMEFINELAAKNHQEPALLLGDLNAEPHNPEFDTLLKTWEDLTDHTTPTWPAAKPTIRIDHIMQRKGSGLFCVSSSVVDDPKTSDHRPLAATLKFLEP